MPGGITAPQGFRAAAAAAGIKPGRNDLALVASAVPAAAAGVFTTNRIQAAPVRLCRQRVRSGRAQAVIINAGNANACTGPQGVADARETAVRTAAALGIAEKLVLVCSTGTIGVPMPMDKMRHGIPLAVAALSPQGGPAAARAILPTDTVAKEGALRFAIDGRPVTLAGMAKGAGMIAPNMATMLAVATTDAAVAPTALRAALRAAADQSFNCVTIDGDQSTNDTLLLLANGCAGNRPLGPAHRQWPVFCAALNALTRDLALRIAADGEGATRRVTLTVQGAASAADARRAARAVAHSLLVKTSWFGADPNWGRVIAAVGYSGARVREEHVQISYDGLTVVRDGCVAGPDVLARLHRILKQKEFALTVDLHLGRGTYTVYTCDCTEEYVRINAAYMT